MRAVALAALMSVAPLAQTFRSSVDAVRVDVLVTNGGAPVAGLTAADFEVRDNNVVQQVDAVAIEDLPVSMLLALDTSYSVRGAALEDLKRAANAALEPLDPADRVALITFSAAVTIRAPWTGDREAVRRAIDATSAGGGTALWDAAYAAITMRDSEPDRRALVVLFSDDQDTASWLPYSTILDRARRSDVVVYGISVSAAERPSNALLYRSGITLSKDAPSPAPLLPELADITGGQRRRAANTSELANTFRRVVAEFRTRYLLTYSPRNVDVKGWHTIDVTLKSRRGQVRARRGYLR